jgi:hypothetical protein
MISPINFELAKLLKEKGFGITDMLGSLNEMELIQKDYGKLYLNVYLKDGCLDAVKNGSVEYISDFLCIAPTVFQIVMWLYEKYEIWITVWSAYNNSYKFSYGVRYKKNIVVFHQTNFDEKDTPNEAYEAGIEYVLKNII